MSNILEVSEKINSVLLHRGREHFPFSLNDEGLKGLLNIHEGLIRKVLKEGEVIRDILYSPICLVKRAPFQVQATPASYGMVATQTRFIISKNFHSKSILPQVYEIDFDDIISLELGKALLLGWIRIKFKCEDRIKEISIIFGATWGIEHFSRAIKVYLETQKHNLENCLTHRIKTDDLPIWQREQLDGLLGNKITVYSRIDRLPVHIKKKAYLIREVILLTEYGLIVISDDGDSFLSGTNIMCIPYRSINNFIIEKTVIGDVNLLKFRWGDQQQILFKTEQKDALLDFIKYLSTRK